jgi:hypothetical protein
MPFKQLVYWSLRTDDLCKAADDCLKALAVNTWDCTSCNTPDTFPAGESPSAENVFACETCGSEYHWQMRRCDTCPVNHLVKLQYESNAGKLLSKVNSLEHDMATYKVDWNELPCDLGEAHKVLVQSRQARQNELMEKHRQEQERERINQQMRH